MKILITEDDIASQRIVFKLLTRTCGIPPEDITIAQNGLEAVKLVKAATTPYDFIYMDHQMPKMNGDAATINIREFEDKQTPSHYSFILCCSATFVGPFHRANCAIPKPITEPENNSAFVTVVHRIKEETDLLKIRRSSAITKSLTENPLQGDTKEDEDDEALLLPRRPIPLRHQGAVVPLGCGAGPSTSYSSPSPYTLLPEAETSMLRTGSPLPFAAGIAARPPVQATMGTLRRVGLFAVPLAHCSPQASPRCSPTIPNVTITTPLLGK